MKCKLPVASVLVVRTVQETCVDTVVSTCKYDSAECSYPVPLLLVNKYNNSPLWVKKVLFCENPNVFVLIFDTFLTEGLINRQ